MVLMSKFESKQPVNHTATEHYSSTAYRSSTKVITSPAQKKKVITSQGSNLNKKTAIR
jgi:hypothetical protein